MALLRFIEPVTNWNTTPSPEEKQSLLVRKIDVENHWFMPEERNLQIDFSETRHKL